MFSTNPSITLWRFEVVYSFPSETSSSALNFLINQPPRNGSCSISPRNGTTLTLFSISCPSWFDEDEIKDYSLFIRSNDSNRGSTIGFSSVSEFEVYLPSSDDLRLMILIRDQRDCLTEWTNLSRVIVQIESNAFDDLLQSPNGFSMSNPFLQILSIPNQNRVGQILTTLSGKLNQIDQDNLQKAVSSSSSTFFFFVFDLFFLEGGIPAASISISSLDSQPFPNVSSSSSLNLSALEEFEKDLNRQANLREYLIRFLIDLPVNSWNWDTIKTQSTTLVQLTQSTHQLSRSLLV